MKAHELFEHMSPELAADVFRYLQSEQKPVYKAAIQGLANQRKLRPVFVERKPPQERHPWMKAALGRAISNMLATHLLQSWLLGAHKPMLCTFLDSLGIAHDDDGTVEQIPAAPPKEKVAGAVAQLLAAHNPETVAVYLHAFRQMDSAAEWPALRQILDEDPRLRIGARGEVAPASGPSVIP